VRPELLMQESSEIIIMNISMAYNFSFLCTRALVKSYINICIFTVSFVRSGD
jgi:hypothetical protein